MKRAVLVLVVLCFISISCKQEENKKENTQKTIIEKKELTVKLALKTSAEDAFKIVMNNIKVDEFQRKDIIITENIPVTSNFENVTANFGANNFSDNLNISLGTQTKTVKFNTIEFSYAGNVLSITKDNFDKFLRTNKFAEFNKEEFSVTSKNDNPKNLLIYARKSLLNFLTKEAK